MNLRHRVSWCVLPHRTEQNLALHRTQVYLPKNPQVVHSGLGGTSDGGASRSRYLGIRGSGYSSASGTVASSAVMLLLWRAIACTFSSLDFSRFAPPPPFRFFFLSLDGTRACTTISSESAGPAATNASPRLT
eukprot:CAMPEP_0184734542 /NCGR_PEP_ID=MMETSP0314-20130426/60823_1 /TAXON_ID=38298 /ORGANISM="Rhodella maculata, Strain CCMP 736" /LENGTH=132 /DNA_ID=CAMNT_0027201509 /DNA_START=378 /DNA_END=776 /DNA_ORIENTATION=+